MGVINAWWLGAEDKGEGAIMAEDISLLIVIVMVIFFIFPQTYSN